MARGRKSFWRSTLTWAAFTLLAAPEVSAAGKEKTAADYYVHDLPGAPDPLLRMYAGHVEITPEHNGNMFFWLFKNRHIANRQRLVLWLNGGPGCSSMDGALMEIGPYRVNEDQTLRLSDGSWDEFANVLFVDNPVGTGFSYVDGDSYVRELTDMATQMMTFLEKFFTIFPEHAHDDIYIAGESYAGQHIPYIAQAILDRNAHTLDPAWNLSGLLIGNGWISGPDQYPSYAKFAKANNLFPNGEMSSSLQHLVQSCDQALSGGGNEHVDNAVCESILTQILDDLKDGEQCYNMYDVRLKDEYPACGMNWPPDLTQMTPYLRRNDVVTALNIDNDKKTGWTECRGSVGAAFRAKDSPPSVKLLPKLLETVPIVLFSGDKDLICNHLGTEELINNLEWNGGKGMEIAPDTWAPRRDWTFEGEPAGIYQEARNLTYIRFYNSSHMVPFDYPRRTRDMLDRFMGVDIASIGGKPADSMIDGEKTPSTSVGGHPNSTVAQEEEQDKLEKATWAAYRRSAEVALLVLVIIVGIWAYFVVRDRRRRAGYKGVFGSDPEEGHTRAPSMASGLGLDGFSSGGHKRGQDRDVEAADFDEAELDELTSPQKERPSMNELRNDESSSMPRGRLNGHTP